MRNLYILFILFLCVGCSKFLDVNDNPNRPGSSTLPLRAKFSAALLSTGIQEATQINQVGGFWGGYWGTPNEAMSQFSDLKQYNGLGIRHQRDGIRVWENAYANLNYFQLIIDEAALTDDYFFAGSSKVIQGWLFLRLVDFYNNVPFSDALRGTAKLDPVYDNGQAVYQQAIQLITDGIENIKAAPNSTTIDPGNHDILFGGDKTRWIQLANTIKLRALVRQSETSDQSYIQTQINIISNEGTGFLAANAEMNPGFTAANGNPFYVAYYRDHGSASTNNRENIRPTTFLLNLFDELNDPRAGTLFVAVNGEYKGVIMGNPATAPEYSRENTSRFRGAGETGGNSTGMFKSIQQGLVFMSAAEASFLQAEAIERGWLNGNAGEKYEEGISRSFQYLGLAAGDLNAYLSQSTVNYAQATDKIERIITQKWLALYGHSNIEAWSDYRRVGHPDIPISLSAPNSTSRPMRFMYPETERMTNNENATNAGDDNIFNNRIWWDQ